MSESKTREAIKAGTLVALLLTSQTTEGSADMNSSHFALSCDLPFCSGNEGRNAQESNSKSPQSDEMKQAGKKKFPLLIS